MNCRPVGAFLGIAVGNSGFLLAGLIKRSSPLGSLRSLTLPLSILAMAATMLLFTGGIPADGFGWYSHCIHSVATSGPGPGNREGANRRDGRSARRAWHLGR